MRKSGSHWIVMGLAALVLGVLAGCALLSPLPAPPAQSAVTYAPPAVQSQINSALEAANQLLAELRTAPKVTPIASETSVPTTAPTSAPAPKDSLNREAQVLALLTTAMQQLNTNIQNAPNAQAQQQAAFNTGVQTAQTAAVAFGGPYGALIAAGIGIVSVLVQGMVNTSKAHQAAQAANATAQTLAGKLPPIPH